MSRKVLITGATGDTGRAAVKESLKAGLVVRAMVHGIDDRSKALEEFGAEVVVGDLQEIDTIRQAMEGMDAAYLVYPVKPGLITATVNFVQAAKEAGVSTVVNLSQFEVEITPVATIRKPQFKKLLMPGQFHRRGGAQMVRPFGHQSAPDIFLGMAALSLAASSPGE